jgi:hypothetical protein
MTPDPFAAAARSAALNLCIEYDEAEPYIDRADAETEILAAFALLSEERRWRPCRDSLPSMGRRVLVICAPNGDADIASLGMSAVQGMVWMNDNWNRDVPADECAVTHWRPLPELHSEQPHVE